MVVERSSSPRIIAETSDSHIGKNSSIKYSPVEIYVPKESFSIKKRSSNQRTPCEMGYLDNSFLDEILNLQKLVLQHLPEAEIFRPSSREDFSEHFCMGDPILGVLAPIGLIAYHVLAIPRRENYGTDISLPPDELPMVAHLKIVAVHPDYRGNGLQRKVNEAQIELMRSAGFRHACCTISPKNPYSLRNFIADGLVIKGLVTKFGGWMRYIMHRDLLRPRIFGKDKTCISNSDIQGQMKLLEEGFCGVGIARKGEGFDVIYIRDSLGKL